MAGILLQIQGGSKWDTEPFIPYIASIRHHLMSRIHIFMKNLPASGKLILAYACLKESRSLAQAGMVAAVGFGLNSNIIQDRERPWVSFLKELAK